jgi:hypothetical protein
MVYTTQQVSLRSILSIPLPLTSIHDIHGAWNGLGSSLIVLYKQLELPPGSSIILAVTLYLAGVATIHITTPALLSLQFHNVTTTENITVLGPSNWKDLQSIDLAMNVQQLNLTGVAGLRENIFYEVPASTSDLNGFSGTANVNALSFNPKCRPLGEAKEDFKIFVNGIYIGLEWSNATGMAVTLLTNGTWTPWGLYQSSQPTVIYSNSFSRHL